MIADNAQLIAAAPALLIALKAALRAHGRTVLEAWDNVPLEEWEILARSAIASTIRPLAPCERKR